MPRPAVDAVVVTPPVRTNAEVITLWMEFGIITVQQAAQLSTLPPFISLDIIDVYYAYENWIELLRDILWRFMRIHLAPGPWTMVYTDWQTLFFTNDPDATEPVTFSTLFRGEVIEREYHTPASARLLPHPAGIPWGSELCRFRLPPYIFFFPAVSADNPIIVHLLTNVTTEDRTLCGPERRRIPWPIPASSNRKTSVSLI